MSGSPLRVLHVIEAMHQGGAEAVVVEHVRHAGAGVESLVCALNRGGPALEAAERAGARTLMLGKLGRRAAALRRLAAVMRDEGVDVVNGHNPVGGWYAAVAAAWARVPVAFRTEHSIHYRGRHSVFYPLLETASTVFTRRVVCVCRAVLESHVRRLPWAAGRFVTVANGISPAPHTRPRESTRASLGLDAGQPAILTIGSLTPQKAQHVLLEAFAAVARRMPAARLLIAGDGPLRGELEARAARLVPGDAVRFLGQRLDAADLLEAADLFALPSEREGLSITLLEAMRAGRAVVATRVGGNGEAIEEGVTGRLVEAGDAPSLAAALLDLLGDPDRTAALGAGGRARWAERFTAARMARETESLYRAELARARRRGAEVGR
jgi:glycosyltransferase involved in cell wall biosynthesis